MIAPWSGLLLNVVVFVLACVGVYLYGRAYVLRPQQGLRYLGGVIWVLHLWVYATATVVLKLVLWWQTGTLCMEPPALMLWANIQKFHGVFFILVGFYIETRPRRK